VLTPVEAFAHVDDPDELQAVSELLGEAKQEAVKRWFTLRDEASAAIRN